MVHSASEGLACICYFHLLGAAVPSWQPQPETFQRSWNAVDPSKGAKNPCKTRGFWKICRNLARSGDGIGNVDPDSTVHIKNSTAGGPQIHMDDGTNSGFINFDGQSMQISTQRDMVDGTYTISR